MAVPAESLIRVESVTIEPGRQLSGILRTSLPPSPCPLARHASGKVKIDDIPVDHNEESTRSQRREFDPFSDAWTGNQTGIASISSG